MTRFPLFRNTGLCRRVLSNNTRRFHLETFPRAGLHRGARTFTQSSKQEDEADSEQAVKTKRTRKTKNENPKPKKEKRPVEPKKGKAPRRGEVLPDVPPGELPPIELWRKYFLTEKVASHRSVVRNPETAAMLAETFVPEGSKDKIIIDVSPGVHISNLSFR